VMAVGAKGAGAGIPFDAKISEVAAQVVEAEKPLKVVDAHGQAVGAIDAQAVINVLVGKGA